jgi:hypothetical protein
MVGLDVHFGNLIEQFERLRLFATIGMSITASAKRSANARLLAGVQSGVLLAQFARNDRHPIFIPGSICTDAYNLSQSAPMRIRREFG